MIKLNSLIYCESMKQHVPPPQFLQNTYLGPFSLVPSEHLPWFLLLSSFRTLALVLPPQFLQNTYLGPSSLVPSEYLPWSLLLSSFRTLTLVYTPQFLQNTCLDPCSLVPSEHLPWSLLLTTAQSKGLNIFNIKVPFLPILFRPTDNISKYVSSKSYHT